MADQKTAFIGGYSLFYPLDSLEALFSVVEAKSRKGFIEKLAKMETANSEGISVTDLKKMIQIGLNYDPQNIVTFEVTSKLTNEYYSEKGYDGLENIVYDSFADSGIIDKKTREDGKRLVEERKRLIAEQRFLEIEQMDKMLEEKRAALKEKEGEDKGEASTAYQ